MELKDHFHGLTYTKLRQCLRYLKFNQPSALVCFADKLLHNAAMDADPSPGLPRQVVPLCIAGFIW